MFDEEHSAVRLLLDNELAQPRVVTLAREIDRLRAALFDLRARQESATIDATRDAERWQQAHRWFVTNDHPALPVKPAV